MGGWRGLEETRGGEVEEVRRRSKWESTETGVKWRQNGGDEREEKLING